MELHYEDKPKLDDWNILSEEDVLKAKEAEAKKKNNWRAPDYSCNHCTVTLSKLIEQHLKRE